MVKKQYILFLGGLLLIGALAVGFIRRSGTNTNSLRLYWFIPDGVRAEPDLFKMYQWAEEGKLPNIKKLMDRGTYGYSRPTFPGHTPTNFATLLTGTYPEVHGVDDGPMHVIGKPLDTVAVGGFRSVAKKVSPIWVTLEEAGHKVALLSIPGSTPPELNNGYVFRGRWGGWGADFHALNFESKKDLSQRIKQGRGSRLFYFGPQLTNYTDPVEPTGWENPPTSFSPAKEVTLTGWGTNVYGYIYDSTDDQTAGFNHVAFSLDKKSLIADLKPGDWGEWQPITLQWQNDKEKIAVETDFRIAVIKLDADGFFRIRLFYNNLNQYITQPAEAAEKLLALTGPMVDFADNFPAQLVYYPEDKKIFYDEAMMSLDWHTKAVRALTTAFNPTVVIHDTYTPNQLLTSRWWMGYIDPQSERYNSIPNSERSQLWSEVAEMYVKLDNMIGEIMKTAGKNTYIVFSSDHGAIPLDKFVYLNNYFADKGWLKFTIDPKTGEPIIDWKNSQVIYLKMAHVYINPNGLAGDYQRGSGPEYEKLRAEVKQALLALTNENGDQPVIEAVEWEKVKEFMQLDPERTGDLVITNKPGYGWNEEMSNDRKIFADSLPSGYKQAVDSTNVPGMWTPFIMAGPGIKKNNYLGDEPIEHIDQYPTIMKALKLESPSFVQGKPLDIFD